jgi:hypothetical protein
MEDIFGTSKYLNDSDGDGLSDYDEIKKSLTSPNSPPDSEGFDAMNDFDKDGLSNKEELELGTSPILADTDGDKINDGDEIKKYKTSPIKEDSDNDFITDYVEINELKTNPLEKNHLFNARVDSPDKIVNVNFNDISGSILKDVTIEKSKNLIFSSNEDYFLSDVYDIQCDSDSLNAVISFKISASKEDVVPNIYYYNEETQFLEEVKTKLDGDIASADVTHFSNYVLINKKKI